MSRDMDNVVKTVDEQADHFSLKVGNTEEKIKNLESSVTESLCKINGRADDVTENLKKIEGKLLEQIGSHCFDILFDILYLFL